MVIWPTEMKTRKSFEQLIVTLLLAVLVLLPTSGFLLFSDTISGIVHQPQLLLLSKRRSCKPYGNSSHPRSSPLIKILKPIRSKLAESFCASTQGISKVRKRVVRRMFQSIETKERVGVYKEAGYDPSTKGKPARFWYHFEFGEGVFYYLLLSTADRCCKYERDLLQRRAFEYRRVTSSWVPR